MNVRQEKPLFAQDAVPGVLHARVIASNGGGPEKTILRTPRAVDPSRFQVAASYIHPKNGSGIDSIRAEAAKLDCPLHTIAESGPFDIRTPVRLLHLCRALNVKIWHAHDYKTDMLGLLLRAFHPMKLVTTVHGWTDETARVRFYRKIDNWCLRRYDRVMTVSKPLADALRDLGVDATRITTIPNGIDPDEYQRVCTTSVAKRALSLDPSQPVIGVVGRLSVEKGVDRLLEPLVELRNRVPNLRVMLLGEGLQRSELETMVGRLGLSEVVRFCGWQRPMQNWYEAMDLLVLPSRTEGMPNVVMEAMAMGVPIAATDVGNVGKLLDHGNCGGILSEDTRQWCNEIHQMLTWTPRRQRLATAARVMVESCFSFATRVERELELYADVLGATRAGVGAAQDLRRAA